jgi:hypothetical protein
MSPGHTAQPVFSLVSYQAAALLHPPNSAGRDALAIQYSFPVRLRALTRVHSDAVGGNLRRHRPHLAGSDGAKGEAAAAADDGGGGSDAAPAE